MIASSAASSAYAVIIEPFYRLRVTRYRITPPQWPKGFQLRLALLADIHACKPWMDAARVGRIAAMTNALNADAILLLGDFIASHRFMVKEDMDAWASALKVLKAPNGVHAILGNHDWWNDEAAMRRGAGPVDVQTALEKAGIPVYENSAVRLEKDGNPFWLAGLGDQISFVPVRGWRRPPQGIDDLPGTLAKITDDAPLILMAHEPDI
ncbi:MAG: metallophosphoesterase, partial [Hyphomicrobiales bacterium]|nr:metallophosphoesterase [Hyphomicrobiales bacterium]